MGLYAIGYLTTITPEVNMARELVPQSFFRFPNLPNLWEDFEGKMSKWLSDENTGISVSEDNQSVFVEAQLPGLQPENIDISLNKNTLWIKGEKKEVEEDKEKKYYRRARNSFYYQVDLPSQVEENSEQAHYEDGVLKITFKKTKQSQVRKISIGNEKKNRK